MDYLLIISAAVAFVAVVLVVRHAAIESKRIDDEMAQIQDDWNYFLQTGDDAVYKRRVKK